MMYICRHINHDTHKSNDNTAIDGLVKIVEVCITFPDAAMIEKGHSRLFNDLEYKMVRILRVQGRLCVLTVLLAFSSSSEPTI